LQPSKKPLIKQFHKPKKTKVKLHETHSRPEGEGQWAEFTGNCVGKSGPGKSGTSWEISRETEKSL